MFDSYRNTQISFQSMRIVVVVVDVWWIANEILNWKIIWSTYDSQQSSNWGGMYDWCSSVGVRIDWKIGYWRAEVTRLEFGEKFNREPWSMLLWDKKYFIPKTKVIICAECTWMKSSLLWLLVYYLEFVKRREFHVFALTIVQLYALLLVLLLLLLMMTRVTWSSLFRDYLQLR